MRTEMSINTEQIRALREVRGWSQEHLAEASGLSLRTIQRVESEGRASRETRLNLAAAFDVPLGKLSALDAEQGNEIKIGQSTGMLNICLGTLFVFIGLIPDTNSVMLIVAAALLVTGLGIYALGAVVDMRKAAGLSSPIDSPLFYVAFQMLGIGGLLLVLGYLVIGEFWWLESSIFAALGLAFLIWPLVHERLLGQPGKTLE